MNWPSASWILTSLPNSVGLAALPLRISSVDGSNRLKILPGVRVSPRKMRALGLLRHLLDERNHGLELLS